MNFKKLVFVGVSYHLRYCAKTEFVWEASAAARDRRKMGKTTDHCATAHGRHPAPKMAYCNNVSSCSRILLLLRGREFYRNAEKSKFLCSRR
jgi:hypothetical protein